MIKIVKKMGETVEESRLVDGALIDQKSMGRGGPTRVEKAQIGLIQFQLSPPKTDVCCPLDAFSSFINLFPHQARSVTSKMWKFSVELLSLADIGSSVYKQSMKILFFPESNLLNFLPGKYIPLAACRDCGFTQCRALTIAKKSSDAVPL